MGIFSSKSKDDDDDVSEDGYDPGDEASDNEAEEAIIRSEDPIMRDQD
jgi:hypothetical protein